MTDLVRGVVSLTRTKRRRVFWCAWWTGAPTAEPFRAPDAFNGGARTEEEALAEAAKAAGMPLEPIEGRWAGAWVRVLAGEPPFVQRKPKARKPNANGGLPPAPPNVLLGVAMDASATEIRAAFRRAALVHHPDHGGEAATFIAYKRAYDTMMRRR